MGDYLRKRENKWISTGKNRVGWTTSGKEKTNGLVQVKTGAERQSKGKRKQWIRTGKNRGQGTNLREGENKWISTGKNRGGGLPKKKRKQKEWYM